MVEAALAAREAEQQEERRAMIEDGEWAARADGTALKPSARVQGMLTAWLERFGQPAGMRPLLLARPLDA